MAEALADLISKVQAASEHAAQLRNEKEISERLAPICNAEPLTQDEMSLCKAFMEWARRKEVRYFPTKPTTVALWVSEHAGHKSESDLLEMLEAIKRMHDQHGMSNPCATCAVERICQVVFKTQPPRSWGKQDQLMFATLPPQIRAVISKREHEREAGLRRKQNELAEEIKKLKPPQPTKEKEVTNG